jgi:hypothetical protein
MNYKQLQQTLKSYRQQGLTVIKLNQKAAILQAEYDRIQQAQQQAQQIQSLTFGVEIEIRATLDREQIARALQAANINAAAESYNHSTRPYWKVITDSSCGYEIVSPVLRGEQGLGELAKVCQILTDLGCQVNRSCGLHVHIGADALGVDKGHREAVERQRAPPGFNPAPVTAGDL